MGSIKQNNYTDLPLGEQLKQHKLCLAPWLLEVIIGDQADKLEAALKEMPPAAKAELLSGQQEAELSGLYRRKIDSWASLDRLTDQGHVIDVSFARDWVCTVQLYKPWTLAAAYGSTKVIKYMLDNGVNVYQKDVEGYNVIHVLVVVAHLQKQLQVKSNKTLKYLTENMDTDSLRALLMDEENKGLRPMELACHFGTFLLLTTIFETKGIYLNKEVKNGIYTTEWFDVTEYETCGQEGRMHKSPILTFTLLDKSMALCPHIKNTLLRTPTGVIMRKWFQAKMRVNKPLVLSWCLVRLFYLLIFFSAMSFGELLLDLDSINSTKPEPSFLNKSDGRAFFLPNTDKVKDNAMRYGIGVERMVPDWITHTMFVYLIIHSSLAGCLDIWEFYLTSRGCMKWLFETPLGPKRLSVHYVSYRIAQFMLSISVIIGVLLLVALNGKLFNIPRIFDHLFLIQAMCCIVISLMFFLQTTSCMGPFIISFERMVKHLVCFIGVFFFFTVPFSFVFRHIVCDDANTDLCQKHFSTIVDSLYTVFTITLNMVNFRDYNIRFNMEIFLMHVQYVFIIIILLLNFLVAHFTRSVSGVMDNLHVLMPIQRLSLTWSVELRLARLMPNLYRKLRRRHFVSVGERLYITRTRVVHTARPTDDRTEESETKENADNICSAHNETLPSTSMVRLLAIR